MYGLTKREGSVMNTRMFPLSRIGAAALLVAVLGVPVATPAAPILFDPDGAGAGASPVTIGGLDWAVGNALAINGNQAVANFLAGSGSTNFEVRYQAQLSGYIDLGGTTIQPAGITGGQYEITVVARFFETVVNATAGGQVTLGRAADQTGSTFEIYFDSNPNANNLAGTGFQDGNLILQADLRSVVGNFQIQPLGATDLFDRVGADNFNGLRTVSGYGGTDASFNTILTNSQFFLSPVTGLNFNINATLPFLQQDPSRQFLGYTPSLGTINGALPIGPGGGGPDFQFQVDGNTAFAVPEPGSLVLVTLGAAGLLGAGWSRRRRPHAG
jgi:hypothetical protein